MSVSPRTQAMHDAIVAGNAKKVRLLLKAGVPAGGGLHGPGGFVEVAAVHGHLELLRSLLDAGASVDGPGLLHLVVGSEAPAEAVVDTILGARSHTQGELDEALAEAVLAEHVGVAAQLRTHGATGAAQGASPVEAARAVLAAAARVAYLPEVEPGAADPHGSSFAGVPRLAEGEDWPACGICARPMQLLIQLELARTPCLHARCGDAGFLQVFTCREPDSYCEQAGDDMFSPFGRFVLARCHQVPAGAAQGVHTDLCTDPLPPTRITGWRPISDLPTLDEPAAATGFELTADDVAVVETALASDPRGAPGAPLTFAGDKLLGWPTWVQAHALVLCPDCGEPMVHLLQLASRDHLAHSFGDSGVAHLVQCSAHPERFGLSSQGG